MKTILTRMAAPALLAGLLALSTSVRAEERMLWISIGDGPTSTSQLTSHIDFAETNNFNAICILARYRANAFYIPNRDYTTYTNNEPRFTNSVDSVQYVIDRAHERGMRVYAAWGCFAVTDGSNTFPAHLPAGSVQHIYVGGTSDTTWDPDPGYPRAITTADSPEGLWVDPGREDVRTYTIEVLRDFVQNYDVDGIIFDRVRYPGDSSPRRNGAYGYNPTALADMGLTQPPPGSTTFINARRAAITTFVTDATAAVRAIKPWVVVGATPVVYGSALTDTYSTVFQHFPSWNAAVNPGHVSGFGALDMIAPQYYRSSAATNNTLMGLTNTDIDEINRMAHIATLPSLDLDGAAPYEHQLSGAAMAQNICDSRNAGLKGFGWFSAVGAKTTSDVTSNPYTTDVAAATTSTCGSNVLGSASPLADYSLKVGWDSVAPNAVTALAANTVIPARVTLTWSAPAAAADGDTATHYLIYRSTTTPVKAYYENLLTVGTTHSSTSFVDTTATGLASGETYYYSVVAVDEYNNKAAATQIGPVSPLFPVSIIESRVGAAVGPTAAPAYQELTGSFFDTSSKSSAAGVTASGSRYSPTAAGASARFSPTITHRGRYHVYVTLDDATSGSNNNATVNWSISTNASESASDTGLVLRGTTTGLANNWLRLTTTPLTFDPGAAGSTGNITFTSTTALSNSARFVMDSVKFEYDSPPTSVLQWHMLD